MTIVISHMGETCRPTAIPCRGLFGITSHGQELNPGVRERFFSWGGGGAKMLICLVIAKI